MERLQRFMALEDRVAEDDYSGNALQQYRLDSSG